MKELQFGKNEGLRYAIILKNEYFQLYFSQALIIERLFFWSLEIFLWK